MKMNLSVVMKTIDKASAPLKNISGAYGNFTPRIQKAQKELLQSKTTLLADIATHKKASKQHKATGDAINATKERLAKYKKQIKAGKPLSAQQIAQLNKQKEKLEQLKQTQKGHVKEMIKAGRALKKAGVMATGAASLSVITSMAEGMDKLTKTAQNIKMPLDELQVMQFQAEHAGVSSDVLGASMIRLTKRLGTMQSTGEGALGGYLKTAKTPVYKQLMFTAAQAA